MTKNVMIVKACFILSAAMVTYASCQNLAPSLKAFYASLIASPQQELPSYQELLSALKDVGSESQGDIEAALPAISDALRNDNMNIRKYAELGFVAINQRSDSAQLLAPIIPNIAGRLHDADGDMQRTAVQVMMTMRPKPPDSVTPVPHHASWRTGRSGNRRAQSRVCLGAPRA